jgi:hypothetical protein
MFQAAILSEGKKACSKPRMKDVSAFLSFTRRSELSPDTAIARGIWEEIEGLKDTGF